MYTVFYEYVKYLVLLVINKSKENIYFDLNGVFFNYVNTTPSHYNFISFFCVKRPIQTG